MDLTKAILLPRHVEAGMTLADDDHFVTLKDKVKTIAIWLVTSDGPSKYDIQRKADEALRQTANQLHGISFEKGEAK